MYRSIWHKSVFQETLLPAVLNSYSVVFFLNNSLLAVVLLLVSFLNPLAGLSGLLSVLLTVAMGHLMGLDKLQLRNGVLTFNALLTGIAMGTFFLPGILFYFLLGVAALLTLVLSASMTKTFFKKGLPFLSLPFILTFWALIVSAETFEEIGLVHHPFFWSSAANENGATSLNVLYHNIGILDFTKLLDIYLRSLSSLLFQNNPFTGAFIAVALLISSRISFLLSWTALLASWCMAGLMGAEAANFTYYNIGANYMMLCFGLGGFFNIPSKSSFLWSVLLIPVTSLVLLLLSEALGLVHLPLFSLPFVLVSIVSVAVLSLRNKPKTLIQTPVQQYSPESNLYTWQNDRGRNARFQYVPLSLPFWGNWTVTQGYEGEHTHKGEWMHALDFMILDHDGKSYGRAGMFCEDYHCYGKAVLALADGFVEEVADQIEDNVIGEINTVQNWGNSIVIRHYPGFYTQLSHLKKGSLKVAKGDFVKKGAVLAACGNSGRSPQPHLHVQVQVESFIGSKTLAYPYSYYYQQTVNGQELCEFAIPKKDEVLSEIRMDRLIRNAFDFQPNTSYTLNYKDEKGQILSESWEAFTDAYNFKYLYCSKTESVAYFYIDEGMFYFTAFYGPKTSLLYYFYLSAYKVYMGENETVVTDEIPFNQLTNNWLTRGVNDFLAPFFKRLPIGYSSRKRAGCIQSSIELRFGHKTKTLSESTITVSDNGLNAFTYTRGNFKLSARCES